MSATAQTEFMLMGLYRTVLLSLDQVCELVGVAKPTAYSQRSRGEFPIPMNGNPLRADIRDVAIYLDKRRGEAQ